MDGQIEVGSFFVDDTIGGKGSHYKYPQRDIEHMVRARASRRVRGRRGQPQVEEKKDGERREWPRKHRGRRHRFGGPQRHCHKPKNPAPTLVSAPPAANTIANVHPRMRADNVHRQCASYVASPTLLPLRPATRSRRPRRRWGTAGGAAARTSSGWWEAASTVAASLLQHPLTLVGVSDSTGERGMRTHLVAQHNALAD